MLPDLMSMMVPTLGPSVEPEEVVATAPVKSTVPKLAKGTRALPSSKSSTIHSAFSPQREAEELMDLVTVLPLVMFSMTAVPDFKVAAVTVI